MASRFRGRRGTIIGLVVIVVVLGAGTSAWALTGGSTAAYRTSQVTRGSVTQTMTTTGTISPVHDAALDFQVAGTVGKIYANQGSRVRAGERVASLDRGSLRSALRSAQSTLDAARAQLVSDEDDQAAAASSSSASPTTPTRTPTPSPTKTRTPTPIPTSSSNPVSKQLVARIHRDQATLVAAQQQTDTDLDAANTALSTETAACAAEVAGTSDGDSTEACITATQASLTAQQTVAADEKAVAKAESVLNADLSAAIGAVTGASGVEPTTGSTEDAMSSGSASDTARAEAAVEVTPSPTASDAAAAALRPSTSSVTASTLAADQANIDADRAKVATAKGDLAEATLRSPISGKVAAVTIAKGDKASGTSSSSNPAIEVVGSRQTNVTIDVAAAQVRELATGMAASVTPDGRSAAIHGTVALIGQATADATTGDTTYPVTIALSGRPTNLVSGADAQVAIALSQLTHVVVVPTSAVHHAGTQTYVETYTGGTSKRVNVTVGAVGAAVTQVTSGLSVGTQVVLANLNATVPSSSTNLLTNGGGLGGGSTFRFNRSGGAGGPTFSGPPPGATTAGGR